MRKFKVAPSSTPNSEINITPLVDVVLVLLIIFMVVTPLLEKDILVRVPDQEKVEDQIEIPQDQLVVSVAKDGQLSINSDKVSAADYVEKLTKAVAAKPRGEKLVFFTADDETNYGKLVSALDGARRSGAEILGMATEKMAPAPPSALEQPGSGEGAPPAP
jgi:biopolymer transport protein ExbD